ncbi:hypothetical protein [Desulfocurvus sp. DL9XJH121]
MQERVLERPEERMGGEGPEANGPGDGGGKPAQAMLEILPEALQGLGLSSAPEPGDRLEVAGSAVCRGLSRRGGSVLQMEVTALAPEGDSGGGQDEQEAFFRDLFEGRG